MEQEEKDLLLQDLCARLPYGLKVKCGNTVTKEICELVGINAEISSVSIRDRWAKYYLENVVSIKPYLHPMSSMTDEEIKDLEKYTHHSFTYNPGDVEIRNIQYQAYDGISFDPFVKATFNMPVSSCSCVRLIKWLNSHHFDYRGLIEKGLALEAPEGMYN